jgi:phosphoserine phosphatase RsbU/P
MSVAHIPQPDPSQPTLVFVRGMERREYPFTKSEFGIGRKTDKDLSIADPRVSRDHATIVREGAEFFVVDTGSRHGTFVNGEKIERRKLSRNDKIEFGVRGDQFLIFDPDSDTGSSVAREFLSQISTWKPATGQVSEMDNLTMFLEAARKLNTSGVLEDVVVTLIDSALNLTRAERGFVFLRDSSGKLKMSAGRTSKGEPIADDRTISHSILQEAASSASEFLVTDGDDVGKLAGRQSVVAQNLRSVICIPLRTVQFHEQNSRQTMSGGTLPTEISVRGVLYLDSHMLSGKLSAVNQDILHTISNSAAMMLENAQLVEVEQANRKYQQELSIAAQIQQRLMLVNIPESPYAKIMARSLPCTEVGGDFFDVIRTDDSMAVVLADVSGKGIPAALMASIIQGMIFSQLTQRTPLDEIVTSINQFLCVRVAGEKYATMLVARLSPDGTLEYVNCGHVPPMLVRADSVEKPEISNFPVGLLPDVPFSSGKLKMKKGDRLVVVSDGVTEAADPSDEMFGDNRLEDTVRGNMDFEAIFHAVTEFCKGTPLNDDCTALELRYLG